MLSLLNIALKYLSDQKQIKRKEFRDRNFVAYQRNENDSVYIYTKSVMQVKPERVGDFDELFDDLSNLHPIITSHYFSEKTAVASIYLPINYHGKNKINLGIMETSFTVLLEVKVEKEKNYQ